jgi:hypothetical protein
MSRSSCALFLLAAAALLAANGSVRAQGPENVNIVTADGVKLRGHFYAAGKKCQATVIMLHPIGEGKSMKVAEWKHLAESLQKADYSVLMFDFRGHGDSTEIAQPKDFWSKPVNSANVKVKKQGDEIDVKDYIKQGSAYLPVLVNDIAAARAYLDRRNDKPGDCNTSSIIVIGADQGATLGAIWINAEGSRYKYIPNPVNPMLKGTLAKSPEGNDIIGAVFLSITPNLDKQRPVSISAILRGPCKERAMAAAFFCGKDDVKAAELAKTIEGNLKVKGSKKHDFIGAVNLETNLSGIKLLTKGLKTDTVITEYLGNVVDDRKVDWSEKEFEKSIYYWRSPSNPLMTTPAKLQKGEKTLVFDDYYKFIPSK